MCIRDSLTTVHDDSLLPRSILIRIVARKEGLDSIKLFNGNAAFSIGDAYSYMRFQWLHQVPIERVLKPFLWVDSSTPLRDIRLRPGRGLPTRRTSKGRPFASGARRLWYSGALPAEPHRACRGGTYRSGRRRPDRSRPGRDRRDAGPRHQALRRIMGSSLVSCFFYFQQGFDSSPLRLLNRCRRSGRRPPVSYTHLTLPTIYSV